MSPDAMMSRVLSRNFFSSDTLFLAEQEDIGSHPRVHRKKNLANRLTGNGLERGKQKNRKWIRTWQT
jgi:hypothetical protein